MTLRHLFDTELEYRPDKSPVVPAELASMETNGAARYGLGAAGIPAERWGSMRTAHLSGAARELYRWILEGFASGRRPDTKAVGAAAGRIGLDVEEGLALLASEDLVHSDRESGEILVAYPFSGRPTDHRVRLDRWREVYAMCAIDALGIPFMLGTVGEVFSRDPRTGQEVWARVSPGEGLWWEPEEAVVLAAGKGSSGPAASSCCAFVNFFASRESAERYQREHAELRGAILPLPDAAEAGRIVFGDLLAEVR